MTPKQARFVKEYRVDRNATQAAIRAGYAESGARTEGARLLANADIAAAIAADNAKVAQKLDLTVEKVLRDLEETRELARRDGRYSAAIKAGELLGKHIGMWPNKVEATINHLDRLSSDEQRAIADALEALARNEGGDASGTPPTHH